MANPVRPGAWPVGTLSGSPWQGSVRAFDVAAAATEIYIGDFVVLVADGTVNRLTVSTHTNIIGACVGVKPVDGQELGTTTLALAGGTTPALGTKYSTGAGTVLVCTAPDTIYEMDTSSGTSIEGATNIGQTSNIVVAAGSNVTGLSAQVVNIAEIGTDTTGQVKIVGIPNRIDNTLAAANCKVHVILNKHLFRPGAGQ